MKKGLRRARLSLTFGVHSDNRYRVKTNFFQGCGKRYFFIAGILSFLAFTVFGKNGLYDVYRLRKERDGIVKRSKSIEEENRVLEEEIRLLKTDKRYVAFIARKDLGMIGKREMVYRIDDAK